MTQYFQIHPDNPQVCQLDDKSAVERLRRIRGVDEKHHLTLLCRDLSEIALYARVDNAQYRMLKATTPGPYTVILEATRELPRRLSHPSRKTIGLRVPENTITQALLAELGAPLIGTTLQLPGDEEILSDPDEVRTRLEKLIDLVIDGGAGTLEPTTVIDLTGPEPVLIREGRGDPAAFGL
jgi:tRNA threonylcarbamoyl adenosine modification protein (Sua5/YciO/YrdC/YwlC family)